MTKEIIETLIFILNVLGLGLGIIGAILMYRYPSTVQLYTDRGEAIVNWVSNPQEGKGKIAKRQKYLRKVGPILLIFAFSFQLLGICISHYHSLLITHYQTHVFIHSNNASPSTFALLST